MDGKAVGRYASFSSHAASSGKPSSSNAFLTTGHAEKDRAVQIMSNGQHNVIEVIDGRGLIVNEDYGVEQGRKRKGVQEIGEKGDNVSSVVAQFARSLYFLLEADALEYTNRLSSGKSLGSGRGTRAPDWTSPGGKG